MKTVIIYLGLAAAGYAAAIPLRKKKESFGWIGTFLMVLVRGLVLLMGFRIGSNAEVVSNLASIGLQSLFIAAISLSLTVGALHLLRRTMGYDRYGRISVSCKISAPGTSGSAESSVTACDTETVASTSAPATVLNRSTATMLLSVLAGFAAGLVLVLKMNLVDYDGAYVASGTLVSWGLYIMVFMVGMDMGLDGTIASVFRQSGLKILAFPAVAAVATLAGVLICCLITPLTLQEAAAVACTFCWYSLGPNIIMDAGMVMAGAYCFLVNFLRVILSLILIPVVAARVGYLETAGMPCAAAMDVCIATIQQATNKESTVCAFASGVLFTAAVPIVVPLIVGL
ncbi:MAG: lysine exporter LysO family protein [Firmicutes bacterium]|nr:lysine exporter LysO family protein [Bacillota bacterium]